MATNVYLSALEAEANGNIDYGSDSFKVMLVTSSYTPDFDTHDFRNDITNEVSGTGYSAGGAIIACTVNAKDTTNNRVDISFDEVEWPTSTITAAGAVIYKSRGGASSADELIAYIDFGGNVSSTADTFTLGTSTLRKAQ